MQTSISVNELLTARDELVLIDVRKPMARVASGLAMPGSDWRHPFDAANWAAGLADRPVVVFCVHGHEVSQSVAGFLRDEGINARYLEGGFEAWKDAGGPVEPMSQNDV